MYRPARAASSAPPRGLLLADAAQRARLPPLPAPSNPLDGEVVAERRRLRRWPTLQPRCGADGGLNTTRSCRSLFRSPYDVRSAKHLVVGADAGEGAGATQPRASRAAPAVGAP